MLLPINLKRAGIACIFAILGCDQGSSWTESGIPAALRSNAVLKGVGSAQDIKISFESGGGGRQGFVSDTEMRFLASIASGTPGELLAAYRNKIRDEIKARGGEIRHDGFAGESENNPKDLAFNYRWQGNEGIVRVYSCAHADGQVEIILICYEHRN